MANPYHDPYSGKFVSKNAMTQLATNAIRDGDFNRYETYTRIIEETESAQHKRVAELIKAAQNPEATRAELYNLRNAALQHADSDTEVAAIKRLVVKTGRDEVNAKSDYENLAEDQKLDYLATIAHDLPAEKFNLRDLLDKDIAQTDWVGASRIRNARTRALLSAAHLKPHVVEQFSRRYNVHDLLISIDDQYKSNERDTWPISAASTDFIADQIRVSRNPYGSQRSAMVNASLAVIARNSDVPQQVAVAAVYGNWRVYKQALANPHLNTTGLLSIYRQRADLNLDQQRALRATLLTRDDLDPQVREAIIKTEAQSPITHADSTETGAMMVLRSAKAKQNEAKKAFRDNYPRTDDYAADRAKIRELMTARETIMKQATVEFNDARAVLDATDVRYNALLKQRISMLTKTRGIAQVRDGYKVLQQRIKNAETVRANMGVHDYVKTINTVKTYHIPDVARL